MMQVTGSNIDHPVESLSILIDRDGLSFYDGISETAWSYPLRTEAGSRKENLFALLSDTSVDVRCYDCIQTVVNTDRFTMIPEELFDSDKSGVYLKTAGVSFDTGRDMIIVSRFGTLVFLWAIEAELADFLTGKFGEVVFTHPLAGALSLCRHRLPEQADELFVQIFPGTMGVTFHRDGTLLLADLYRADSPFDPVFYLDRIVADYKCRESSEITAAGVFTEETADCLARYFPKIRFMRGIGYLNYFVKPNAMKPVSVAETREG